MKLSGEIPGLVAAGSGSRRRLRFPFGNHPPGSGGRPDLRRVLAAPMPTGWVSAAARPLPAWPRCGSCSTSMRYLAETSWRARSKIIVAVLGIAITVVSIVVQLAATRYTPRIADMFFPRQDQPRHHGLFVVGLSQCGLGHARGTSNYIPRATIVRLCS